MDKKPPELVGTTPDSGALGVRQEEVAFRFDEVVSERPQGTTALEGLFLISPRDGDPRVSWKRGTIAVRGRRAWKPNTVYTVTMLPGLADLRGNVRKTGATVLFSTGVTPFPETAIRGRVFDWVRGTSAPRAYVEAVAPPDTSTVWVTETDSSGGFVFGHMTPGRYVVRGVIDANTNHARDPREAWDSTVVLLADTVGAELLAFVHDTVGPGIASVDVTDSVTLRITFDRPLGPTQPLDTSLFTLSRADSTRVAIATVRSASAAERAARDTVRAARDTTRAARPSPAARAEAAIRTVADSAVLRPSRPSPVVDVVLTTQAPLGPGSYLLSVRPVRGILGEPRASQRAFNVPRPGAPPPARPAAPRRDSTSAPAARPPQ